jgi:hypothetical protein
MSVIQQAKPLAFSIEKSDTLYYNADELKVYNPRRLRGIIFYIIMLYIKKSTNRTCHHHLCKRVKNDAFPPNVKNTWRKNYARIKK